MWTWHRHIPKWLMWRHMSTWISPKSLTCAAILQDKNWEIFFLSIHTDWLSTKLRGRGFSLIESDFVKNWILHAVVQWKLLHPNSFESQLIYRDVKSINGKIFRSSEMPHHHFKRYRRLICGSYCMKEFYYQHERNC